MNSKYKRTNTTVSLINYHFVFCPRYRRKIFNDPSVEERFKDIVIEVCKELDIDIVAMECHKDHTHLFINSKPNLSPSSIMARIKGVSSRRLREDFPYLNKSKTLWTHSFFVSTAGDVSSETIKKYVEEQKIRG
jgi:REP element-mobilizing transposase RayT